MERLEYLEYFSEGPIAVTVKFKNDPDWIAPRYATPWKIAEIIEWLQENNGTPMYFDGNPFSLMSLSYNAGKNALKLYVESYVKEITTVNS